MPMYIVRTRYTVLLETRVKADNEDIAIDIALEDEDIGEVISHGDLELVECFKETKQ